MNHFGKTVFAMPPNLPFGSGNYSDEWNRAASALTAIGLALPLHYAAGLLFKLGPDGGIVEHAPRQAQQFVFELAQLSESRGEGPGSDADDDGEDGGDGGGDGGDGGGDGGDGGGDGGDGGGDGGGP
jgi:hypothetical protein